jgi:hypothetical protein
MMTVVIFFPLDTLVPGLELQALSKLASDDLVVDDLLGSLLFPIIDRSVGTRLPALLFPIIDRSVGTLLPALLFPIIDRSVGTRLPALLIPIIDRSVGTLLPVSSSQVPLSVGDLWVATSGRMGGQNYALCNWFHTPW